MKHQDTFHSPEFDPTDGAKNWVGIVCFDTWRRRPYFRMQHPDPKELNKAPLKEEVEALRVTLSREERLLQVLASEIATVSVEHERASQSLAQAQAGLDAASVIYRTSETMLLGLEAQHDQLLKNVAEKKAALHPIRRVPAELWADIFTQWVDEEESERVQHLDSTLTTDVHTPATLIAASVSHFWRKTALSTPTLVCVLCFTVES